MRILVVNPFADTEFRGRENLERIKRPDTTFEMVNIAEEYPLKNNQFLYFRYMCTGPTIDRIIQAEISRGVDDAFGQPGETLNILGRVSVRLCQEEQVTRFQGVGMTELQIGCAPQVGVGVVDKFAHLTDAGNLLDGYTRMKQQESQQLTAHVAAAADNGNIELIGHLTSPRPL